MAPGDGLISQRGPAIRRLAEPGLIAAALAVGYLLVQPESADHAAQAFRSGLFESNGLSAWNNLWFGGHHLPGYSVLFPPLASLLGAREAAALAVVASALLFGAIAYERWGDRARLGVIWFAAGASVSLYTGRLTFAFGVMLALAAVFAAQRGWRFSAIGLALATPLASPVAGLFLACGAVAYWVSERSRFGFELAVAALGSAVLVTSAFPEGGTEPFVYSSFQPALLVALATFFALPRDERLLRTGVATYALALAAAFAIDSPMGGNATRMGALLLGPTLAFGLWRRQHLVLAMLAPILIFWQWSPVVRDLERVHAEPSVNAGFYEPVRDFLRGARGSDRFRVEVLPVENHWEAAHIPRGLYIARGWERQLDRKLNKLFYEPVLAPGEYRRWLDELSVRYVAVPDAPLDYAAEAEAALIARGLPYLERVFSSRNWTVYEVREPEPITVGAADLARLRPHGFVLNSHSAGSTLVRIRWTPYWIVKSGTACLEESPSGFTRVLTEGPGRIVIGSELAPWRALGSGRICSGPDPADGA